MSRGGEFQTADGQWAAPIENKWTTCKKCHYNIPAAAYHVTHRYCPACGEQLKWGPGTTYECKNCKSGPCRVSSRYPGFIMHPEGLGKVCVWTRHTDDAAFVKVEEDQESD